MQSLILAGGKGTRLRPLTLHTPKPILPIGTVPFLLYQLELLKRADIRDVLLSLSYQPNKIQDQLGDGSNYDVRIEYTVEASPLGTAGAYRNAAGLIRETAVVLNGDILIDIDLNDVLKFHREYNAIATVVLAPVPNPAEFGLVKLGSDGRVESFLEKPKPEEVTCNTVNAGVYILDPTVLDYIRADEPSTFEYAVFPLLREKGLAFYGYVWNGYWRDIGTPSSYLQANMDLLAGKIDLRKRPNTSGSQTIDEMAEVDASSIVDPSSTLKAGVQIVNSVVGRNCYIEERAHIENSVIRGGTRVGPNAVVRGSVVGRGCHIGRLVTVGAGSVLGDKSVLTDYCQIGV